MDTVNEKALTNLTAVTELYLRTYLRNAEGEGESGARRETRIRECWGHERAFDATWEMLALVATDEAVIEAQKIVTFRVKNLIGAGLPDYAFDCLRPSFLGIK